MSVLPWIIGFVPIVAFLAVGGWNTDAGKLIALVAFCLCAASMPAVPFLIRGVNRKAAAERDAFMRRLDQSHRERQAEGSETH